MFNIDKIMLRKPILKSNEIVNVFINARLVIYSYIMVGTSYFSMR